MQRDTLDAAMAADVGSTAIGLAAGLSEANPLGFAILPLKLVVRSRIEAIGNESERDGAVAVFAAAQWGAAAGNLCTLAAAAPPLAAACFAGAAAVAYARLMAAAQREERPMIEAYRQRLGNRAADCLKSHLPALREAAAAHRSYSVSLDTCGAVSFAAVTP